MHRAFGRWLTRMLLLAAVLVLSACKSELHTNLSETDANEILAALLTEGVKAKKETRKEGVAVLVETRQFGTAVEVLKSRGLPRRRFDTVSDVFKAEGLVASPLQEWAKFNYAKAQELSKSISGIPGVIRADVHLGETRKDSPFEKVEPPSASVLIQMREDMISERLVPEIKQLVALAHPNIDYDRVGVVVTPVAARQTNVTQSEVAGIMVQDRDARTIYYILAYCGAVSLLGFAAAGGLVYQWWKRKALEAQT